MPAGMKDYIKSIREQKFVSQEKRILKEIYEPDFKKEYAPDIIAEKLIDGIEEQVNKYENIFKEIDGDYKKNYKGRLSKVGRFFSSKKKNDYEDFKSLVLEAYCAIKELYWCVGSMKINNTVKYIAKMKNDNLGDGKDSIADEITEKERLLRILGTNLYKLEKESKKKEEIERISGRIASLTSELEDLRRKHFRTKKESEKQLKNSPLYGSVYKANEKLLTCLLDCMRRLDALNNKINGKSSVKGNSSGKMVGFGNDDAIAIKTQLERLRLDFSEYKKVLENRKRQRCDLVDKSEELIKTINMMKNKRIERGYITTVPNDLLLDLDKLKSSLNMGEDEDIGRKILELNTLIESIGRVSKTKDPQSYMRVLHENRKRFKEYINKSEEEHNALVETCSDKIALFSSILNEEQGELKKSERTSKNSGNAMSFVNRKSVVVGDIKNKEKIAFEKKKREFENKLKDYYIFDNNMRISYDNIKNGKIPKDLIEKSGNKMCVKVEEAQSCFPVALGKKKLEDQYDHKNGDNVFGCKGPYYIVIDKQGNMIKEANHPSYSRWSLINNCKINSSQEASEARDQVEKVLKESLAKGQWCPGSYGNI